MSDDSGSSGYAAVALESEVPQRIEFEKALDEALCKISGQSAYKHLVMTRYKDGIDIDYPTVTAKDFADHIWKAACASRQKEIDILQAQLREQHQNQLDLMGKLQESKDLILSERTVCVMLERRLQPSQTNTPSFGLVSKLQTLVDCDELSGLRA